VWEAGGRRPTREERDPGLVEPKSLWTVWSRAHHSLSVPWAGWGGPCGREVEVTSWSTWAFESKVWWERAGRRVGTEWNVESPRPGIRSPASQPDLPLMSREVSSKVLREQEPGWPAG
jgi:hypothetical protein